MQGKYSYSIADYHQVWHFQNNSGSHVKAASLPEREPEAAEERIGGRRATTERARRSDSYTSNYCIYSNICSHIHALSLNGGIEQRNSEY